MRLGNKKQAVGVDSFWQDVARGCLLIAAVAFDQLHRGPLLRRGGEKG